MQRCPFFMDASASEEVIQCNSSLASKSFYKRLHPLVHQQELVRWESGWSVFSYVRLSWSYYSGLTEYHQSEWPYLPGPYCNRLYFTHMKSTWKGAMGGYSGTVVGTELLHSSAWKVKLEPLCTGTQIVLRQVSQHKKTNMLFCKWI